MTNRNCLTCTWEPEWNSGGFGRCTKPTEDVHNQPSFLIRSTAEHVYFITINSGWFSTKKQTCPMWQQKEGGE